MPIEVPPPPPGEHESRQLIVNYLAPEITSESLVDVLSEFGNIAGCRVILDHNGVSKGYAFVYTETQAEAISVIEQASGRVLLSKRMKVGFAAAQTSMSTFKSAASKRCDAQPRVRCTVDRIAE